MFQIIEADALPPHNAKFSSLTKLGPLLHSVVDQDVLPLKSVSINMQLASIFIRKNRKSLKWYWWDIIILTLSFFSIKVRKRIHQACWRSNWLWTSNWYWKNSRLCTLRRSIQCNLSIPIMLSSIRLRRRCRHYIRCNKEKRWERKPNQTKRYCCQELEVETKL